MITHGRHETLRRFHGSLHFARDQRLRRVLDVHGKPLSEHELERQRGKIKEGPFVVRECENPFAEDLIADGAVVIDPQLPALTKTSCLVDALRIGGSYELVEKLREQFVPNARRINPEVPWTRDEVLVGSVSFRSLFVSFQISIVVLLLVNRLKRNAAPNSVTRGGLG